MHILPRTLVSESTCASLSLLLLAFLTVGCGEADQDDLALAEANRKAQATMAQIEAQKQILEQERKKLETQIQALHEENQRLKKTLEESHEKAATLTQSPTP